LHVLGFQRDLLIGSKFVFPLPDFQFLLMVLLLATLRVLKVWDKGDPISPYLFVIAMEMFTRILGECTKEGTGFKYHFRCSKLKLTHLCFADDLLIFSDADLPSISIIQEDLVEFENLSGLKANPSKSSFFCSGLSSRMKISLLDRLQMQEGHLPVRYFGVPLISTKLSAAVVDR
jgi:hypothetical protein